MDDPKNFRRIVLSDYSAVVQERAKNEIEYLYEVAEYRKGLHVEDRLQTLLWSWPIRRVLSAAPPRLFCYPPADEEPKIKVRNLMAGYQIKLLAGAWYPLESPPLIPPNSMGDDEWWAELCHDLDYLGHLCPPSMSHGTYIANLIEDHWGDPMKEQFEHRCGLQYAVLKEVESAIWPRICEIGEEARDTAFLSIQIMQELDAIRTRSETVPSFIRWLKQMPKYYDLLSQEVLIRELEQMKMEVNDQPMPNEELRELRVFHSAFHTMYHTRNALMPVLGKLDEEYQQEQYQGLDRRPLAGQPLCLRPWVNDSESALKQLDLTGQQCKDLQMAWGLRLLERSESQ